MLNTLFVHPINIYYFYTLNLQQHGSIFAVVVESYMAFYNVLAKYVFRILYTPSVTPLQCCLKAVAFYFLTLIRPPRNIVTTMSQ